MRRGLWLAAGAVLGVAGYRRATRMVDTLAHGGFRGVVPPSQHRGGSGSAGRRAVQGSATALTAAVTGRPDSAGHSTPGRPASTAAKIAATAGFVRDVRDGMAEYLELHHRELARNLGSRSNRT
jgi:hypothetical protein